MPSDKKHIEITSWFNNERLSTVLAIRWSEHLCGILYLNFNQKHNKWRDGGIFDVVDSKERLYNKYQNLIQVHGTYIREVSICGNR